MATETSSITTPRYFKIPGGTTVLVADGHRWIRWDQIDGPVETSIWRLDSPGLTELTELEAKLLISSGR